MRRERRVMVVHSEGLAAKVSSLEEDLKKMTEQHSRRVSELEELNLSMASELESVKEQSASKDHELVCLQLEINSWIEKLNGERVESARLKDLTENIQLRTYVSMKAELMQEFISHGGAEWDPQAALDAMDNFKKMMARCSSSKKNFEVDDGDDEDEEEEESEEGEEKEEKEEKEEEEDQPKAD